MYSNDDLDFAVKKGIFTETAVDEFRESILLSKKTSAADEENFKLIGGYNDVFVVIGCCLFLFSCGFILNPINESFSLAVIAIFAWGLSEFFVLKRKMALTAIVLVIAFVSGVGTCIFELLSEKIEDDTAVGIAALGAIIAAYFHWRRFKVPIVVAAGVCAAIVAISFSIGDDWLLVILFICGIMTFLLAMWWDAADTRRISYKSDVAFWLHLLASALIVHPIFSSLGFINVEGTNDIVSVVLVFITYIILAIIAIAIDRRAFMISALGYVLYVLGTVLDTYNTVDYNFSIVGFFMGAMLLVLSVFWRQTRQHVVFMFPAQVKAMLPPVHTT